MRARSTDIPSVFLLLALAGCTLAPEGTDDEFARLAEAGTAWRLPPAERDVPDLPAQPTGDDVVARALLVNGELEAAWHSWRAALERVLVASGWPNTDLSVGLTSFVAHGAAWDTSAVSVGFDPMQMLLLPDKVRAAGEEAFGEALAAGRRFESLRLQQRERALSLWIDWVVLGQRLAVEEQRVALAGGLADSAAAGVRVGGAQEDLLRRRVEAGVLHAELEAMAAERPARLAELNALLARAPDAPLPAPDELPAPEPLPPDEVLLAADLAGNPDLAATAAEVQARRAALRSAGLRWFPNAAPSVVAGGGMDESYNLTVTLPLTVPAVVAAVRAAQADLDAASALMRQAGLDKRAALVATLAALHGDDARLARLEREVQPAAQALLDNARSGYVTGAGDLAALADARNAALDAQLALLEARGARARRVAALERVLGRPLPPAPFAGRPLAEEGAP
jgi:outer membrane protein, heavy metal efflux system